MSKNVTIEEYSERSFVVRGETKECKDELKQLGGKWNSNLKGGGGWIYPISKKSLVEEWKENGLTSVSTCVSPSVSSSVSSSVNSRVSKSNTDSMMKLLTEINNRLKNIETHLNILPDVESEEDGEKTQMKRLLGKK